MTNMESQFQAPPMAMVVRQAKTAPGSITALRPKRSDSQPESQLVMAQVSEVPEIRSPAWKALMWNRGRMMGRM